MLQLNSMLFVALMPNSCVDREFLYQLRSWNIINVKSDNEYYTSIHDLFGDLTQHSGEPGFLLKGLRYREGLSQIEFSRQLNSSQTNLSAVENGRRTIGKELAKRIAEIFGLDYRIFL